MKHKIKINICRWHDHVYRKLKIYNLYVLLYAFGKVTGYMSNVQKSVEFLYTSNEQSKLKINERIPFMGFPGGS